MIGGHKMQNWTRRSVYSINEGPDKIRCHWSSPIFEGPLGENIGLGCKDRLICVASQSNRSVTFSGNRWGWSTGGWQSPWHFPPSQPTTYRGDS